MSIGLPLWVIYRHPADYPHDYVARLWDAMTNTATASVMTAPTLALLRMRLPPYLHRLEREPGDDPTILESWI